MKSLDSYKALSFDVYGTLIDWIEGIKVALQPLALQIGTTDVHGLAYKFDLIEGKYVTEYPGVNYIEVLKDCYIKLYVQESGYDINDSVVQESIRFASSVSKWPAHKDTVEAMKGLKRYYKLIALSNIDWVSFKGTLNGPFRDVHFDATYIAEDIGTYKPDLKNFEYLIKHTKEDFGINSDEILHITYSIHSDIIPCTEIGLDNVWIARYENENLLGGNLPDFEKTRSGQSDKRYFNDLKEFLDEVAEAHS